MGIQVTHTPQQPTVVYDQVHLVRLEISQPPQENHAMAPRYHVMIVYKLFGIDQMYKRHYHADQFEIEIDDFLAKAMAEYAAGDPTLVKAFKAIESAIASLIESDRGISAQVV